jgi:RNA polymerase sigma-70 factor (ECF subfamily)
VTGAAHGGDDRSATARAFREEWGRVVAALARAFGDLDLAEDAAQEAFEVAARTWPQTGVPANPGAWITTTARRRAIDRLRREQARELKQRAAVARTEATWEGMDVGGDGIDDDLLRLIFMCCHPALEQHAQVALTLRLVAGLDTAAIARAFLAEETTLAQRLVRAKRKVRAAAIPLRVPDAHELPDRLAPVLAVVMLVFNEGYLATTGDALDRPDLCDEAIHLARTLLRLMPDEPEVRGLLALLLLVAARREARIGDDGALVPLPEQDRARWDGSLVAEGQALVRDCLRLGRPGPYQLHAAMNAVHADAATAADTDWVQILALHDQLQGIAPTPVGALNRAVAVAEVQGPRDALTIVEGLDLAGYHLWHATRADLLQRLGDPEGAADDMRAALALTDNDGERRLLEDRLHRLAGDVTDDRCN